MSPNAQALPSVDQVLQLDSTRELLSAYSREYVVGLIRQILQSQRENTLSGSGSAEAAIGDRGRMLCRVETELAERSERARRPSLRRAINATGVILHTGLGRAPLSAAAAAAIQEVAENYCGLELDLASGSRGSRLDHVAGLIGEATGCEESAVVNNNAGAVLLMLNTLAREREVIVSRGELVEIGGSFRIPDIIEASGARIREVGTTNRTHLEDYKRAISAKTAMILVVHESNYRVQGFTASVELSKLVEVGRSAGIPVGHDLGGGVLVDLKKWGLPYEPVVAASLAVGVDLVTFSGDKVLGGPQCGIVAGGAEYVERIRTNPMMRALRCDKLILAGLEATLRQYRQDPTDLPAAHPVLGMMTAAPEEVAARAVRLMDALDQEVVKHLRPTVEACTSQVGSGAMPLEELSSSAVVLSPDFCSAELLARALRCDRAAVVGRIHRDRLLLDMRTVRDDEIGEIAAALLRTTDA
jgi:L-seryl-tRNA(Ser) seleniumtransferase